MGIWNVEYSCSLAGENAEKYELEMSPHIISPKIQIVPRILYVELGDAQKEYYTDLDYSNLVFQNGQVPVRVSGFYENGRPSDRFPTGFKMPALGIDNTVINKETPMYENGIPVIYQNAIIIKDDNQGNPTANYCYDLTEGSKFYKKGSIMLTPGSIQDTQYDIRSDNSFRDENGILWVKAGTSLTAVPKEGSGYNTAVESGPLSESGIWQFSLIREDGEGKAAASLETSVSYKVDGEAPEGKISLSGLNQSGFTNSSATAVLTYAEDKESGIRSLQARQVKIKAGGQAGSNSRMGR